MRARTTLFRLGCGGAFAAVLGVFVVCSHPPEVVRAQSQGGTGPFSFTTQTCRSTASGTDGPVYLTIQAGGKSVQFPLDNPDQDDRQSGQRDIYRFSWPAGIGSVETLEMIRLDLYDDDAWCVSSLRFAWDPDGANGVSGAADSVPPHVARRDTGSTIWEYRSEAPAVDRLDTLRHAASGPLWLSNDFEWKEAPSNYVRFTDITVSAENAFPHGRFREGFASIYWDCPRGWSGTSPTSLAVVHDGLVERIPLNDHTLLFGDMGVNRLSLAGLDYVRNISQIMLENSSGAVCLNSVSIVDPAGASWGEPGPLRAKGILRLYPDLDIAAGSPAKIRFQGLPLRYAENSRTPNSNWHPEVANCAAGLKTTCGLGECKRSGEWTCAGETATNTCKPGRARPEIPGNAKDDNCNGTTDESIPEDAATKTCADGYDNDLDSTIDCADLSCNLDAACRADDGSPAETDYGCEAGSIAVRSGPDGERTCAKPQCANGSMDPDELKVDCGGVCPPCPSDYCENVCRVGDQVTPPAQASLRFSAGTFSRAGMATFEQEEGLVSVARPDELRWVARDGLRLALFEGPGTNLLARSTAWQTSPPWVAQPGTQLQILADQAVAPDGQLHANRVQFPDGPGRGPMQTVMVATRPATFSMFGAGEPLSTDEHSPRARMFATSSTGELLTSADFWLDPGFMRFDLPITTPVHSAVSFSLSHAAGWPAGETPELASSPYYVWGAQLEEQPFPTSFIPTTATSASRSPDTLTFEALQVQALPWLQTGVVQFDVAPLFSSTEMSDGVTYTLLSFGPGADVALLRAGGVTRLRVQVEGILRSAWREAAPR